MPSYMWYGCELRLNTAASSVKKLNAVHMSKHQRNGGGSDRETKEIDRQSFTYFLLYVAMVSLFNITT